MRRRLRRQQRVREALLLDLGALVYELHRHGRREPELLQAKAAELSAVDDEVRALAEALDERRPLAELVAAGISGSCESCGALLTSDARFCSTCGAATSMALAGEQAEPEPEIAGAGDGAGLSEEDEHAAIEAAEPEPEPELERQPEPEPDPSTTADWTHDVGVPSTEVPPPWSASPPPTYEPLVDRARKAAQQGLRRGRDWLDRHRRG